jgi:hypothetical protein
LLQSPEDFIKEANLEADGLLLMYAHNELPQTLSQLEAVVVLLCPALLLVCILPFNPVSLMLFAAQAASRAAPG